MSMTPRQQDQAWIEADRAENERTANLSPWDRQFERMERFCGLVPLACGVNPDGSVRGIASAASRHWRNGAGR